MRRIGGIFGRRAFGPLYEHMLKVADCVRALKPVMDSFLAGDHEEVERLGRRVSELEHEADRIKGEIRNHLSGSIFGSAHRSDTLMALKLADNVADAAQKVAKLLMRRDTREVEGLKPHVTRLVDKVTEAADKLLDVIHMLHDAEETLVGGTKGVLDALDAVRADEFEADRREDELQRAIYAAEGEMDPVTVFVLIEMTKALGRIADAAENTADCITRMVDAK